MTGGFREAGGLAAGARYLLYIDAGFAAAAAALLFIGAAETPALALFWLVQLAVYVCTAIVFFVWLYRANANARALGADDMMAGPGMAIGWYFVPLANLAMPFVAMRELWKASTRPKDWQAVPSPATIPLWWTCWLIAGFTGIISFRMSAEFAKEASEAAQVLAMASELFEIGAALLLAQIVRGIQALQEQARGSAAATVFV